MVLQVLRGVPVESEVVAEPRERAMGDGTGQCMAFSSSFGSVKH